MRNDSRSGFTLLELIVVITIIGILSTVVAIRTTGFTIKARRVHVVQDLQSIVRASELIFHQTGKLPASMDEFVTAKDEHGKLIPGCLEKAPKDPWSHSYIYEAVDGIPHARCLGSDGAEGGDGEAEDVEWPEAEAK